MSNSPEVPPARRLEAVANLILAMAVLPAMMAPVAYYYGGGIGLDAETATLLAYLLIGVSISDVVIALFLRGRASRRRRP